MDVSTGCFEIETSKKVHRLFHRKIKRLKLVWENNVSFTFFSQQIQKCDRFIKFSILNILFK